MWTRWLTDWMTLIWDYLDTQLIEEKEKTKRRLTRVRWQIRNSQWEMITNLEPLPNLVHNFLMLTVERRRKKNWFSIPASIPQIRSSLDKEHKMRLHWPIKLSGKLRIRALMIKISQNFQQEITMRMTPDSNRNQRMCLLSPASLNRQLVWMMLHWMETRKKQSLMAPKQIQSNLIATM